jgi:osmoprotectant transport system substrate-binding protein
MNVSLKYQAIGDGEMDATTRFPQTVKSSVRPQESWNDKGFFPPYNAAPIIRNETLENHP